jgi:hypothetical protein
LEAGGKKSVAPHGEINGFMRQSRNMEIRRRLYLLAAPRLLVNIYKTGAKKRRTNSRPPPPTSMYKNIYTCLCARAAFTYREICHFHEYKSDGVCTENIKKLAAS